MFNGTVRGGGVGVSATVVGEAVSGNLGVSVCAGVFVGIVISAAGTGEAGFTCFIEADSAPAGGVAGGPAEGAIEGIVCRAAAMKISGAVILREKSILFSISEMEAEAEAGDD